MTHAPRHSIHRRHHHLGWDNAIPPLMTVAPGDVLEFETIDASGGQITADSGVEAVSAMDPDRVNPVTGPIAIDGAEPGDAVKVTLLSFAPSGWGWTANIPGFGLLADQFPDPALHVWRYDADSLAPAEFGPGGRVPLKPFAGTIGLAPAGPAGTASFRRARSAAIWTSATSPPAPSCICRWPCRAPCSRSATPTPPKATARSAAPPSKAR